MSAPFRERDLGALDGLLSRAAQVVAMEDVFDGATDPDVIGLRHDVDNFITPAVQMAEWEAERGYRSTYFVLHSAPYWNDKALLRSSLERIAGLGHEIGFHANAVAEALRTGRDPDTIVVEAVTELRDYGYTVRGVVAHGDQLCHIARFVNDEMFAESARPDYGLPDRELEHRGTTVALRPVPRSSFGFEYDPNWISRAMYLSDSGGRWSQPFDQVADGFPYPDGQLHILVHPCWWGEAFVPASPRRGLLSLGIGL